MCDVKGVGAGSSRGIRMTQLFGAAASFAGLHMLVSGTPARGWLMRRIGVRPYRALFSLGSIASLVWLIQSYTQAYASDNSLFWSMPYAHVLAVPIVGAAMLLAVPGITSFSPTGVGQEFLLLRDREPYGMQRISRHPFLWGVMIWSGFHLLVNGNAASIVLFGTFFVVAARGTCSIDAKRARALGAHWVRYRGKTSNLPFAAIASGRTQLAFSEIGAWRVILALAVLALLIWLHPQLFHAYAVPGVGD